MKIIQPLKHFLFPLLLLLFQFLPGVTFNAKSQDYISIHREQNDYHRQDSSYNLPDGLPFRAAKPFPGNITDCSLSRIVFGYEPYWGGNNYYNYQWNLVSDMCYFSYETDPVSGYPTDTHNWLTRDVIDTALAYGVNVHLCITLFSGHSTFFSGSEAQDNLIYCIIALLEARGGSGVNIDFEAMPSSVSNDFTEFIAELRYQMDSQLPGKIISIAVPAVNWNETFDIPGLIPNTDYFMIMGYDYYWNGSSQAGPVAGLYSMTGSYDYNLSRTLSYYLSQGVEPGKIILGLPYYGREWPTEGPVAPSNITGWGEALTYEYVRYNATGHYNDNNRKFEPGSASNYFSFDASGWYQCFMEDTVSLGRKYDLINRMDLAGLGIWALGYDGPYPELWELIAAKFSDCQVINGSDTIYDSGGPYWNYYNNESYSYTIKADENHIISLVFTDIELEPGSDSLWIYDGNPATGQLLEALSGQELPLPVVSSGNEITLRFYSDGDQSYDGWKAVYTQQILSGILIDDIETSKGITVFPNPCSGITQVKINIDEPVYASLDCFDIQGRKIMNLYNGKLQAGETTLPAIHLLSRLKSGLYILQLSSGGQVLSRAKFNIIP